MTHHETFIDHLIHNKTEHRNCWHQMRQANMHPREPFPFKGWGKGRVEGFEFLFFFLFCQCVLNLSPSMQRAHTPSFKLCKNKMLLQIHTHPLP